MECRIIKTPTKGTRELIKRRMGNGVCPEVDTVDAVGLVQGKMIEMVVASDIAEKAVGVTVADVKGSCPQNMILIAIFGDTSSVEDALMQITRQIQEGEGKYSC